GAAEGRARVRVPCHRHAAGARRRRGVGAGEQPAAARRERGAAAAVDARRRRLRSRSRAARRARTADSREAARPPAAVMTFPYLTHGATLALAWFALVNIAVSAAVALIAGRLLRTDHGSPRTWFLLRLLPAISSALFVVAL